MSRFDQYVHSNRRKASCWCMVLRGAARLPVADPW
jgi:hypothetical protein